MQGFLNPDQVLDKLDIKSDMVAAEFGCGSGGFTIPLAKKLEDGMVFGIDILQAPLSALKSRANLENIVNIRLIRSDLEKPKGSTLSPLSLGLVVIPNVLFQVDNKSVIIIEASRVLKKGALLVVIDWLPEASQGPAEARVSPDDVKKLAEKSGFKFKKQFEAGKYHYCLIFEKQ